MAGGSQPPHPGRRGAAGPEPPRGESLRLFQPFPPPGASAPELGLARSWGRIQAGVQEGTGQAVPRAGGWMEQRPTALPILQQAGVGGQLWVWAGGF